MKRFIIACCCAFLIAGALLYAYYYEGFYLGPTLGTKEASTFVKQEGKTIYLDRGNGYEEFEIKGVDLGVGIPGHFATDYAIDKETYLRWFEQIKEMGANTIRVYILQGTDFYEAFYEYNKDNPDPLYLIHGVWIVDYAQNSHMSGFDDEYLPQFKDDVRTMIDAIHGNRFVELGSVSGTGVYTKDVSDWVIGYILGVEWESPTVAYTNLEETEHASFTGEYMSTTEDASPFEAMLAEVGNEAFRYETQRYGEQRLVAFSNWPLTDPFEYPLSIAEEFHKYEQVDVEHLTLSDGVVSGTFASYHIYPYYPDYFRYVDQEGGTAIADAASDTSADAATEGSMADTASNEGAAAASADDLTGASGNGAEAVADSAAEASEGVDSSGSASGERNTYVEYLTALNNHHADIPVIISEFGIPSARGMTYIDQNTGRNQGYTSEEEQAREVVRCYQDIMDSGCSGAIVFSWQDEWFKRTWNTWTNVDLLKSPYWSDYQTNEQSFGLLAFDPGDERSVSYVDGDDEEWTDEDIIGEMDGRTISCKYDEKFVYLMVRGDDVGADTTLYLPIDTTQKSGSTECDDPDVSFDRDADFVVVVDGEDNSRVLVQERYEVLRATQLLYTEGLDPHIDPPESDSSTFVPIYLVIRMMTDYDLIHPFSDVEGLGDEEDWYFYQRCETGNLTYGDANPDHEDFNSLADFCFGDGFVEIKIPWQLLNFSNPAEMQIHDDYYEKYGVENMSIDSMYIGIGDGDETISLFEMMLEGWGMEPTYHERLKESYYALQQVWAYGVDPETIWNVEGEEDDTPPVETVVTWRDSGTGERVEYVIGAEDTLSGNYSVAGREGVASP